MFKKKKKIFAFRGPVKYFESAPPELGRWVTANEQFSSPAL